MAEVRAYRPEDAASLAELYVRSVKGLGARDYSDAQVEAWASLAPSAERLQALAGDGRERLVVMDAADRPSGFLDLEADGHIHYLYVAPEASGSGAAAALYEAAERLARERGMRRLYAEASEAALRFLLRQGFVATAERRFEVAGVPIHNYAMEKSLHEG